MLNAKARYVISDLNQPMLNRAIAPQAADPRITWKQADALQLPFENEGFDAGCCQFGVMFFPDRVAADKEALRVLRPGGRFFQRLGCIEDNDFAQGRNRDGDQYFFERPAPLPDTDAARVS